MSGEVGQTLDLILHKVEVIEAKLGAIEVRLDAVIRITGSHFMMDVR